MIDLDSLRRLSKEEATSHLAPHSDRFREEDPVMGMQVDIEVLVSDGARVLRGGAYENLVVPDRDGALFIDGDLDVSGVFEHPFRSAPVFVSGNLNAGHIVTCACLVVMGDVKVGGVFYGNCTNYCTHVFGGFAAEEIILEKNHHFAVHGKAESDLRLEDERDGYEATEEWMQARGVASHDEGGLAEVLRESS